MKFFISSTFDSVSDTHTNCIDSPNFRFTWFTGDGTQSKMVQIFNWHMHRRTKSKAAQRKITYKFWSTRCAEDTKTRAHNNLSLNLFHVTIATVCTRHRVSFFYVTTCARCCSEAERERKGKKQRHRRRGKRNSKSFRLLLDRVCVIHINRQSASRFASHFLKTKTNVCVVCVCHRRRRRHTVQYTTHYKVYDGNVRRQQRMERATRIRTAKQKQRPNTPPTSCPQRRERKEIGERLHYFFFLHFFLYLSRSIQ